MERTNTDNEFTDLLSAQRTRLFAYICALVHNLRDAEDIYQETAITLWQKFDEYQSGTNFAAWARTMARLKVLEFLRSKRRHHINFNARLSMELAETLAASDTASGADVAQTYHRALLDCMDRLTAMDQQLIARFYSRTCTLTEIAKQHGRSLQSVSNSLRRIRGILFDCIKQAVEEDQR